MKDNTRIVAKIKAQISKFSGIISKDFSNPKRQLIKEVLYDIQAIKNLKPSNLCRSLDDGHPLKGLLERKILPLGRKSDFFLQSVNKRF